MNQIKLKKIAEECAIKIENAEIDASYFEIPFKHAVIDNFFSDEFAKILLENFPSIDSSEWERTNDADIEVKLRTKWESEFDMPEGIADSVRILNSSLILKAMSNLFDIEKLIPDPYFSW